MFYKIENDKIVNSSNVNIDWTYIEIDLTQEQINVLNQWANIVCNEWIWEVVETSNCQIHCATQTMLKMISLKNEIDKLWWVPINIFDDTDIATWKDELIVEYNLKLEELKTQFNWYTVDLTQEQKIALSKNALKQSNSFSDDIIDILLA